MLRFDAESAFEEWLLQCPLDPRLLSYSVNKNGNDGLLTVNLSWKVTPSTVGAPKEIEPETPLTKAPPHNAPHNAPAANALAAADEPPPAAEAERLQAMMAKMQSMLSASPAGAAALKELQQGSSSPGTAAAMLSAQQSMAQLSNMSKLLGSGGSTLPAGVEAVNGPPALSPSLAAALLERRPRDADGQPTRPTREEIRAAISLASGGAFPSPPT